MTRKAQVSPAAVAQKTDAISKALAVATSHHVHGYLKLAEDCYREVLARDANNVQALHMLGLVAFQTGKLEDGIRLMKRAARKSPRDASILVNLGAAYRQAERNDEAREAYETAIKLKPDLWEAHYNLGKVLIDIQDFDGAKETYRRCIELDAQHPDAYVNLGNAYKFTGEGDRALGAYEQALKIAPNLAEAYGNICGVWVDRGKYTEALAFVDKAISIDPRPGELRFKRSLIALRLQKFSIGWADYESRFCAESERIAKYPSPPGYWSGEDLAGKTILVWSEQGLGDEILYANMIHEVISLAGKCIIECSPRMVPVFARSFPLAKVVRYQSIGIRTTQPSDFDVQSSVASLGQYLRPTLESFPLHAGYLKADSSRVSTLRARYRSITPGNLVVGISWRSKNDMVGARKSTDLSAWSEVLSVPGVTFVNLQYGDCEAELAAVKDTLGVEVYQDPEVNPLKSLDEFFAQVGAMDLVISTSNTTVHVAGSLNIPTWLILTSGPASLWYWFHECVDSPWYPSIKIFRRPAIGSDADPEWWRDGIDRVVRALTLKIEERRAGGTTASP